MQSIIIFEVTLVIMGLLVWSIKRDWTIFYVVILTFFGTFIEYGFFISESHSLIVLERGYFYAKVSYFLLFIVLIIKIILSHIYIYDFYKKTKLLIFSLSLVLFYIILWSFFHGVKNFEDARPFLNNTFPSTILVLYMAFDRKTTGEQIKICAYIVFILQVIFVVLQQCGIYTYYAHQVNNGLLTQRGVPIISGTFIRFNVLANVLLVLFIIISLEFFSCKKKSRKIYFRYMVFFILSFYMIFLSGARTALILSIFFLFIIAILYFHLNKRFSFLICILFIASSLFVLKLDIAGAISLDATSTVERQIYGLATLFTNTGKGDTVLDVSKVLLQNYFSSNPFWGVGMNQFDYNLEVITLCSDARIAFILTNYGLLGFFILMLFFITLVIFLINEFSYRDAQKVKKIYIIFFLLFLLGVTEFGLWGKLEMLMCIVYSYYLSTEKFVINMDTD